MGSKHYVLLSLLLFHRHIQIQIFVEPIKIHRIQAEYLMSDQQHSFFVNVQPVLFPTFQIHQLFCHPPESHSSHPGFVGSPTPDWDSSRRFHELITRHRPCRLLTDHRKGHGLLVIGSRHQSRGRLVGSRDRLVESFDRLVDSHLYWVTRWVTWSSSGVMWSTRGFTYRLRHVVNGSRGRLAESREWRN